MSFSVSADAIAAGRPARNENSLLVGSSGWAESQAWQSETHTATATLLTHLHTFCATSLKSKMAFQKSLPSFPKMLPTPSHPNPSKKGDKVGFIGSTLYIHNIHTNKHGHPVQVSQQEDRLESVWAWWDECFLAVSDKDDITAQPWREQCVLVRLCLKEQPSLTLLP